MYTVPCSVPACLPVCPPARLEAEVASGALMTLLLKLGNFPYAPKLSVKSPSLSPPVPSAFTLVPLFSGICKVRKFYKISHLMAYYAKTGRSRPLIA